MNLADKNLKAFSDGELTEEIRNLFQMERKITQKLVASIVEVDQRKLYLRMAYPSLFDYLTKEIGYSAGAAQRRIDAARMAAEIPEVSAQIEDGTITLNQISKIKGAMRDHKKRSGKKVEVGIQKQILEKVQGKSLADTELILAQEFQLPVRQSEKKIIQQDESVRVEVTFSKEEMEIMRRAQAILSNKAGGGMKDTILEMARKEIKAAEGVPSRKAGSTVEGTNKTLTPKTKRFVLRRDRCCHYKNPKTGKVCGSKFFLTADHIQPRFAGGDHETGNLRVLCKNHNVFRYKEEQRRQ